MFTPLFDIGMPPSERLKLGDRFIDYDGSPWNRADGQLCQCIMNEHNLASTATVSFNITL